MKYKYIYMVGIGGIGMSAIARYYNSKGCSVSGYDRTPSEITSALQKEGIDIHFEESVDYIPQDKKDTLAIYTPAIPEDSIELRYLKNNDYRLLKRSRVLGEIAKMKRTVAISGTHGKTTVSTMTGHIFQHSGIGCNAFLGGISKNYGSNLLLSDSNILVAEADEFDRSFLQLFPETAVITSIDADHLDIYNDYSHVKEAFEAFASQTNENLVIKKGVTIDRSVTKAKIFSYSYDQPADFYASDIKEGRGGYFDFTINYPGGKLENCSIGIPGWVNVENGIAAAAASILSGVSPVKVREALKCFSGVKRRFDIHLNTPKYAYIDDYAHHPKEIEAALSSMRDIFPGRKITAIFQPHLYTRTRDFADEFASALSKADRLILLNIYPARELPISGVSSSLIFDKVTLEDKVLIDKSELMDRLADTDIDVLVTFGAGDIDRFTNRITDLLKERLAKC